MPGVRVVATDAVACALRMIRMNALVAGGTRRGRGREHVMRRVAVGATVVRRDVAGADHVDLRVAVAARRGLFLLELMRLVTIGTGGVSAFEEGGGRNDRLLFGVTGAAGL